MAGFNRIGPALVALAACQAVAVGLSPEAGSFLFQHYPASAYGASPQNWAITQDQRGLMYFGNTDGLLEFDGVSWRKILLTNKSAVRSLAVAKDGTVYVGGQGEIGYLRPDSTSTLQYVSLLPHLPEPDRQLGDVWSTFATPDGVFFCSFQKLVRIRGTGDVKIWRPLSRFGRAIYIHGRLAVVERGKGLEELRDDTLALLPGGDFFSDREIRAAIPSGSGMLVQSGPGLYEFVNGRVAPFTTAADTYIRESGVAAMSFMPDGGIVVGTRRGGLAVLDKAGVLERVIDRSVGLPSDSVTALYVDRQGSIWLALADGIVRFQSNLTDFGQHSGIRGNVVAIARQAGTIFAGTTAGLYRMKPAPLKEPAFDPVERIRETVLVLFPLEDRLLAGGVHGIYSVKNTQASLIVPSDVVFDIAHSIRDRDVLYTAGSEVLLLRRHGDGWEKAGVVKRPGQEFRSVAEDNDGRVWATTRVDIWRMNFTVDPPQAERFDSNQGVPAGWKNVYRLGKSIVFATEKGLLRFSKERHRFEPDNEFGTQFAGGGRPVSIIREGAGGRLWITGQGYHAVVLQPKTDARGWFAMPLLHSGIEEFYSLWLDADGVAWASGADGALVRFEPAQWWNPQAGFRVLLRRVQVTGENVPVFGGASSGLDAVRLPHNEKALRFNFAATSYEDASHLEYQVWLEGLDRGWSPWTGEAQKDYTNLFERSYRFRVRARDGHGFVTPEVSFDFRVLPPWYRSWWAYSLYASVLLFSGWLVLRWRLGVLKAQNQKLESIVEERTAEIRRQRDQIQEEEKKTEQLLLNILPSPVAAELRSNGSVAPVAFADVTVCFTDFVGFTLSSEKLPASQLVSILNEYFTAFDRIMDRYGLEKLKTIGDSYMFVSGLPEFRASHAVDAVLAALEIVNTVNQFALRNGSVGWQVRAGLETGPVVAGVVGVRKFAFDVWGDTVNFASRMESCGSPGCVNLSARMYDRVRDFIDCEPRGLVRTKEGREVEMYFARGLRLELLQGKFVNEMPEAFRIKYEHVFSISPRACPNLIPLASGRYETRQPCSKTG